MQYDHLLETCPLTVQPGQIIGYVHGRPVRAIAGGSAPLPGGDPTPAPAPTPSPTPAPQPAPQPAPAPAPQPQPQPQPAPAPAAPKLEDLLADLPEDARTKVLNEVQRARGEAARYRTERQTAAQQAQAADEQRNAILKALGLNPEGQPAVDPVQAAADAKQEAWVAKASLAIYTRAGALGADAARLVDSVSFLESLDQHVNAEPGTPEFASQVDAAITSALEHNPAYRATTAPSVPPASGNPLPGTPGEKPKRPTSLGEALRNRNRGL